MSREGRVLARDLRNFGASEAEIAELLYAAERLRNLRTPGLSDVARERIASHLPVDVTAHKPKFMLSPRITMAGAAAIVLLVAVSGLLTLRHGAVKQTEQAHEVTQPKQVKNMPQQHVIQPQYLQRQDTIAPQPLQDTSSNVTMRPGINGSIQDDEQRRSQSVSSNISLSDNRQPISTKQSSPLKTIVTQVTTALPIKLRSIF